MTMTMRHNPLVLPLSTASKFPASPSIKGAQSRTRIIRRVLALLAFCTLVLCLWISWSGSEIRVDLKQSLSPWPATKNGPQEGTPLTSNGVAVSTNTNADIAEEAVDVIDVAEAPSSFKPKGAGVLDAKPEAEILAASPDKDPPEAYYKLGSTVPLEYRTELESFIHSSFPPSSQPALQESLDAYFPLPDDPQTTTRRPLPPMVNYKHIWQTSKRPDKDWGNWAWHNAGWEMHMLNDTDAAVWVKDNFDGTPIEAMWDGLPAGILKADVLRYLLVLIYGGVYSDTDTVCLKSIEKWGASAELWRNGAGWLPPLSKDTTTEAAGNALGPPSFIVGIEADFSFQPDWQQIAQWTFAGAPRHPILLEAVSRAAATTRRMQTWGEEGEEASARIPLHDNGGNGGRLSVLEWTGPGVFTDAVFRYLEARYGFAWRELARLEAPLRVGDVVMLPMTGFSPGVRGAGAVYDPMAMVQHKFYGSWKGADR